MHQKSSAHCAGQPELYQQGSGGLRQEALVASQASASPGHALQQSSPWAASPLGKLGTHGSIWSSMPSERCTYSPWQADRTRPPCSVTHVQARTRAAVVHSRVGKQYKVPNSVGATTCAAIEKARPGPGLKMGVHASSVGHGILPLSCLQVKVECLTPQA